ncbi:MAG: 2-hydroxyacyl-CoA dehydratase family protein [Clostridiales Family XIII bacterium]|jgi:benzoyl-CoA reductase/2-hydroxyglutaryl-CoA dehydratase subunit BcrC/BadD/HgdB|nr:2-hydroxyacyl-CoA dehydratase family protein [Clostridiales Family XIII bacterium]
MSYRETVTKLRERALDPAKSAAALTRETGKPLIGCFPVYAPEEIIYAAGALPVGMWGGKTELKLADRYLQSFCCSVMRANLELGLKGSYGALRGVVIPTFCDSLKCVCENWKTAVPQLPALPIVYPQNRSAAGTLYMKDELARFKGEAEKLLRVNISEEALMAAWETYEDCRAAQRGFVAAVARHAGAIDAETRHLILKAAYFSDRAEYARLLRVITEGLASEAEDSTEASPGIRRRAYGIKAVLTGYMSEPAEILRILDENGVAVVGDDLAHASRQFRVAGRREGCFWELMAGRMADQSGCAFLYDPNKSRGRNLLHMVREADADAVIVFMMKFCDPEEFDYPIYRKELEAAGVPVLCLEVDQQTDSFEQIRTRVQSFAETLGTAPLGVRAGGKA